MRKATGRDLDVYFLQLMLRHHVGGAPMAEYASTRAGQPAVRTLAENMLKSQSSETELMKDYLAKRGAAPLPRPRATRFRDDIARPRRRRRHAGSPPPAPPRSRSTPGRRLPPARP